MGEGRTRKGFSHGHGLLIIIAHGTTTLWLMVVVGRWPGADAARLFGENPFGIREQADLV